MLGGALGGPARAQDDPDARAMELYDNGVVLYDEGRYEDAVAAWEQAYQLSARAILLYNIANAEERLGLYAEALDHLNRYRAFATGEERDPLDRRIANLERRLAEQRVEAPLPEPEPVVVLAAPAPVPVVTVGQERRAARPVPLALFAVGGLGLASGTALGGMALGARGEAGDLCVVSGRSTFCPARAEEAIQRDRTLSTIADVGFAVAIGGALGGSIGLLMPRDRGVALAVQPDAVMVAGVF